MNKGLKIFTISYKKAEIAIREKFSFTAKEVREVSLLLKEYLAVEELLVLSTCLRTEVYYISDKELSSEILSLLSSYKGHLFGRDKSRSVFTSITEEDEVVQHLFYVAAGLESQVVGDLQVAGQVKDAYRISAELNLAGPFLHRLLHSVFFINKKISEETSFRDGAVSFSSVAARLAEELSGYDQECKILIIGLGDAGRETAEKLLSMEYTDITIANRTFEKAVAFASENKVKVIPFEDIDKTVLASTVVISTVGGGQLLINKDTFRFTEILSYKYFIDLAVPRSIDERIEEINGVLLFNIDTIKERASLVLENRKEAIPLVKNIIAEGMEEFKRWKTENLVSPVLRQFKEALDQIRKEELSRYLKGMDRKQVEMLEEITGSLVQKIMKLPALQLQNACKRGEGEQLAEILQSLFNLEKK